MRAAEQGVDPRPFSLGVGPRAVLFLHGLTGTPYEVRPVALALAERGFAVSAPLLAGHEDLAALEASRWRDWYASADAALSHLVDHVGRSVLVVGFSMGALLTLRLAAERPEHVAGIVAVSAPLELPAWQRHAVRVLARMRRSRLLREVVGIYPKGGPDIRIKREVQDSPSLAGFPYPTLEQLVELQREVWNLLPRVRTPLLLLHGRFDHSAPVEDSARIAQVVGSDRVRRVILPRSFHVVGRDLDRDLVCREIEAFAATHLSAPSDEADGVDEP